MPSSPNELVLCIYTDAIMDDNLPASACIIADKDIESASKGLMFDTFESGLVRGVIFSKSVRSAFCSFDVILEGERHRDEVMIDSKSNCNIIMVRIQFPLDDIVPFRSHCRRCYKLGDLMVFHDGSWSKDNAKTSTTNCDWRSIKLILGPQSLRHLETMVRVEKVRYWSMKQCQELTKSLIPAKTQVLQCDNEQCPTIKTLSDNKTDTGHPVSNGDCPASAHGSGLEKRVQAQYVAQFLVHMIMYKLQYLTINEQQIRPMNSDFINLTLWATTDPRTTNMQLFQQAVEWLNAGNGVIDAAGGSGHVSMQLGLMGVRSTVIDAREAVGKLPGRDRKIWKHALKRSSRSVVERDDNVYCQPIIPYEARRGWFGPSLSGVDTSYRHPDETSLTVYDRKSDLFLGCSAVIALHPDEATEAIVSMSVEANKPLVVVPCCVFARVFPNRLKPGTAESVRSRADLLHYLAAKHESIGQTTLPFQGANTLLWSFF
ncbi:hypothetical protein MPSEU_000603200 [Mayamaea pseudoterrestris]|nr:hypothetical protein MPSEU_000603200 [Mayamaea pseudoterrestris]